MESAESTGSESLIWSPVTGATMAIQTGTDEDAAAIQDLVYSYDGMGNLSSRQDQTRDVNEYFYYDPLNRLIHSYLNESWSQSVSYDAIGNIRWKSDVGEYSYGDGVAAGPHTVTQVGDAAYQYDAVGNLLSGGGRSVEYTSFRKPKRLSDANSQVDIVYGPNRGRIHQTSTTNGAESETWYFFQGLYEEIRSEGAITQKHYVTQGNEAIAIVEQEVAEADPATVLSADISYLHKDHLGSVHAVTNENGELISVANYDPFGQQRILVSGDEDVGDPVYASISAFSGHEQLAVNLVHMNGRVYDPALGRFLSADPLIAQRYDPQNLNRYSYVRNNPLGYVDRNGFSREHPLRILEYFGYREFQFFAGNRSLTLQDYRAANIYLHQPRPIHSWSYGYFVGGGYKSTLVDADNYLLTVYRYIELNLVRASMVNHASEYPWSSYQGNALGKPIQLLTPHSIYQQLGKTDVARQGAYRTLFRGRMPERDLVAIREATNKAWALGDDWFKAQIAVRTGRRSVPSGRGGDRKSAEFQRTRNQ